jgi:hypothetical protein
MHPGKTVSSSTLRSSGPLKATIASVSNDGKWSGHWEIYPSNARMTVTKVSHNYWFLYEGTPGGQLETGSDFVVRSDGTQTLASASWTGDIGGPEWCYFADGSMDRSLFLVQENDDGQTDSYYPMNGEMTVFGFGRQSLSKYMSTVPNRFRIGLMDERDHAPASTIIEGAYRPLSITIGAAESNGGNLPPVAEAGADQTLEDSDGDGSEPVTLDGSGSNDADGTIVSYSWTEGGVEIATGVKPSVDLAVGSHTITLTVADDDGATATDALVVIIEASSANLPPVIDSQAWVDPATVTLPETTLAGVVSHDPDDGPGALVYTWEQVNGPGTARFSPNAAANADYSTVSFDQQGEYLLRVTVSDGADSASSEVPVTVLSGSGLFAYYPLDDGNGTTAADHAGDHDGTLVNGPAWTTGRIGGALQFDGSDDRVHLGALDVAGDAVTLSVWFKADRFDHLSYHDARLISKASGSAEQDHYWMLSGIKSNGTRLRFRLKTGGTTSTLIASSGDLAAGAWIHAAAVYDGSSMKLYKDGVLVGQMPKSGNLSTSGSAGAFIGANPDGYGPFDGVLDDVRIYGRALSDAEISALASGTANTPPAIDSYHPETPFEMDEGQTQAFAVQASDADDDPLTFSWALDGTPLTGVTGSACSYAPGPESAGQHALTVRISDGQTHVVHTWTVTVIDVPAPQPGDLNGDHVVNIDDLVLVTGHFGQSAGDPNWDGRADADRDGNVTVDDLVEVTSNFGKTYP